jgi:uncharacterized protein YciI
MAKFVFILGGKNKGTLTEDLLQSHIDHLKKYSQKGNLFLCGPFEDNNGAMQILEANSREEALEYFLQDPFIAKKYYETYTVYELIEANEKNNWLLEDKQTKSNLT